MRKTHCEGCERGLPVHRGIHCGEEEMIACAKLGFGLEIEPRYRGTWFDDSVRVKAHAAIYSVEVAEAAIEVLKAYVKQQKWANNGGSKRAVDEGPNLITAAPDLFKQLYETHCMLMFKDSWYLESDLYIKNAELLDKARGKP